MELDSSHQPSLFLRAVLHISLGHYTAALPDLESVLNKAPDHRAKNILEMALATRQLLDRKLSTYNRDVVLAPQLRRAWTWRDNKELDTNGYKFQNRDFSKSAIHDVHVGIGNEVGACTPLDPHQVRIIAATQNLAKFGFQYDSPGFLTSRRMHRAFNLATLQIAQSIRARFFIDGAKSGAHHQKLKNSSNLETGKNAGATEEFAELIGWRELADVSELWRIHAEPLDEVPDVFGISACSLDYFFIFLGHVG